MTGGRRPTDHTYRQTRTDDLAWVEVAASGLSNAEVARQLGIGEGTAKTHVACILIKLGVRDRVQAAVYAHQHEWVAGSPGIPVRPPSR